MEHIERRLRLYEKTDEMVAVEQPFKVAESGLDALVGLFSAEGGVCVIKSDLSSPMELTANINISMTEQDRHKWSEFSKREDLAGLREITPVLPESFNGFFGDIFDGEFDRAFMVPLMNDGDAFGVAVLLGNEGSRAFGTYNESDALFVSSRISTCYRAALRYQEALGLAYIDSLTDLYNARYLPIILAKKIEEAKKAEEPLSLLFLDMDNFREINNEHGHQAGGSALVEVGWILERHVRAQDTVIRYGGDEFTVVLPTASIDSAIEIAQRIRMAIKEHVFLRREGHEARLTASIGVATFPDDAATPEALLHLADQAMYRGKETTRDAVYSAANREI